MRYLAIAAVLGAFALLYLRPPAALAPAPVATLPPPIAARPAKTPPAQLVVDVAGAVRHPGLYRLRPGARADDAVRLAGGMRPDADAIRVNLAAPLRDGELVAVPAIGDRTTRSSRSGHATSSRTGSRSSRRTAPPVEPVDLNSADAGTLAKVPGIGPALAERIVRFRDLNGPFLSFDELADIAGISVTKADALATYLRL